MKKLFLFSLSLILLVLNSCKKDTVDVTDLLTSVPSSAAGVIVISVEDILEDAGCKVKDHKVIPGQEVKDLMARKGADQTNFEIFFEGNSGIELKGAVVFYDANRAFLTFALHDTDLFCKFIEQKQNVTFTDEGSGVKIGGNVAVKGTQAWICLTPGKQIDADAISSYASLAVAQSFLVTPAGEKLLTEEDDIRGWAILDTFIHKVLDRSQQSMARLTLGFLFEKAESVEFKVDFKKGEIEAEAIVLNEKGKPAKYLLPTEKIDVGDLKTLGTTCDAMMAFTVNSKLIKKLDQISSAFGGAFLGNLKDVLENVDGTIGIATGGEGMASSVNGFLTKKGAISSTLKDLISGNVENVKEDGKFLRFTTGDVKGNLNVEKAAEDLKGCCLGFVADPTGINSLGYTRNDASGFRAFVLKFKPESGGLEMEFELKTQNENENGLLTLLKGC